MYRRELCVMLLCCADAGMTQDLLDVVHIRSAFGEIDGIVTT